MMKKYLLVFVAFVMGVAAWGQSASKHLTFKELLLMGRKKSSHASWSVSALLLCESIARERCWPVALPNIPTAR